mmetsp:Transcript_29271/g.51222  ORF Transcript_29271/g.51222 Transcript_29271/m.51222 type:complete len:454 (-) Transcript_29271:94-1455(-)
MLHIRWFFWFFLTSADAGLLQQPAGALITKLNDGLDMPMVGLGTWRVKPNETEEAVLYAICGAGYRHIDAAQIYHNQREVGAGLRRAYKECGAKREQIWLTSKIWYTDFHPDDVPAAVDRIIDELGSDYVDQILLHWPTPVKKPPAGCPPDCPVEFAGTDDPERPRDAYGQLVHSKIPLRLTWMALEKVRATGKVKSIGVSNFDPEDVLSMILDDAGNEREGAIKPAVNQVECHVFWNQEYFIASHQSFDIQVVAYSPLGNPERWPDGQNVSTGLHSEFMKEIAAEAKQTPAQVMLNFLLLQNVVVIPKSITPERIMENIRFGVGLTSHVNQRLMNEAPQMRLNNPNNRPGGKPVFDDAWIEQVKEQDTMHVHTPTKEDIAYHRNLQKMKLRAEREKKLDGILTKFQEATGQDLGDRQTVINEILEDAEKGGGLTKVSGSTVPKRWQGENYDL